MLLVIEEVRPGKLAVTAFVPESISDRDETIGILVVERAQDNGVNHAEYRGIRADTEGKNCHGQQRESGVAAQRANSEFQVHSFFLEERFPACKVPLVFMGFPANAGISRRQMSGFGNDV